VLSGFAIAGAMLATVPAGASASSPYQHPTWWSKYERLLNQTALPPCGTSSGNFSQAPNIDMSNEATPQSETTIAIDPTQPSIVVGGSNEIVCDPMRGYFSSDGGKSWGAVDLPLPPPLSTNGQDFGSDPGVAWDTLGNVYYSYIVVFFNPTFSGVQGSEMAVARSQDFGRSWKATFFNLNSGNGKFNDKPMLTVDTKPGSPHVNTLYVAWDNASPRNGKSSDNDVVLVSSSTDHGVTFSAPVAASPGQGGPAAVIGADPFVAPDGTLYVAWQDSVNPAIRESSSRDGGATFGPAHLIADTLAVFQVLPPAQALRGALIYPACAADPSAAFPGRLYCSWSDQTATNGMDVFVSHSDDGATWSPPVRVNDDATGVANDQFNQWLAVDPSNGALVVSWNDSRNDATHLSTDIFMAISRNGGASFSANLQVTNAPTNETCCGADLGNQYGDYEGISAFDGVVRPIWTDRRASVAAVPGLDEEVFTEAVKE
jgi:hypothetical protein